MFAGELSSFHAAQLRQVARAERAEEEARRAAEEAAVYRAASLAPAYAEATGIQRAWADAESARAERAEGLRRSERAAEMEDFRTMLLATGRRERTVAEVLAGAAGAPAVLIDSGTVERPPAQASRSVEVMIDWEPLDRRPGGALKLPPRDAEGELLARSQVLSAAWDGDPVIRRARAASLEAQIAREEGRPAHRVISRSRREPAAEPHARSWPARDPLDGLPPGARLPPGDYDW
jgi:hypothetical protein